MRPAPDLTQDRLKHLLNYCAETGVFTWQVDRKGFGGKACAGLSAGTPTVRGYRNITIDRRSYRAHVLAWFYFYETWPSEDIDHIDGDRSNNAIANLREASRTQNLGNSRRRSDNTSGAKGVSSAQGKWKAEISCGRVRRHLGYFSTKTAAAEAYTAAARQLFGEFARIE